MGLKRVKSRVVGAEAVLREGGRGGSEMLAGLSSSLLVDRGEWGYVVVVGGVELGLGGEGGSVMDGSERCNWGAEMECGEREGEGREGGDFWVETEGEGRGEVAEGGRGEEVWVGLGGADGEVRGDGIPRVDGASVPGAGRSGSTFTTGLSREGSEWVLFWLWVTLINPFIIFADSGCGVFLPVGGECCPAWPARSQSATI